MNEETWSEFGILDHGVCHRGKPVHTEGTMRMSLVGLGYRVCHQLGRAHAGRPANPVGPCFLTEVSLRFTGYKITVHAASLSGLLSPHLPKFKDRITRLKEKEQDINVKSQHLVLARRQEG